MNDLTLPNGGGIVPGNSEQLAAQYNKVSETLRRVAPPNLACTLFCGGRRCKYESPSAWTSEQCVVSGMYSSWINDDVLAMTRLNSGIMREYDVVGQFQRLGVKSVINLQVPGEHSQCCPSGALDPSGFSYDPTLLMNNGIYFYNYAWRDYGEASLAHLLDMVKVLSFSVSQGRKAAVHCHAGLGRTGVLIACYLVYAQRLRANDAIRLVRAKRGGSIQSRLHILCVQQFEQFILPNCVIFCNKDLLKDKKIQDFTIQQYLKRQRFILHGREGKILRNIPKILNVILERILVLCGQPNILPILIEEEVDDDPPTLAGTPDTIASPVDENGEGNNSEILYSPPTLMEEENANDTKEELDDRDLIKTPDDFPSSSVSLSGIVEGPAPLPLYTVEDVVRALLADHTNMAEGLSRYVRQYRLELNQRGAGGFSRLSSEKNLYVLTALFFYWLEHLRAPLLGGEELTTVVLQASNPQAILNRLSPEAASSVKYIMSFVNNLNLVDLDGVLRRLAASLTHRIVPSRGQDDVKIHLGFHTQISDKGKPRVLSEGTLTKLMTFLNGILLSIKDTNIT